MGSSPIRVAICNLKSLTALIPYPALYSAFASVAQLVEQGTENPRVSGSIPLWGTIFLFGRLAQLGERLPYKQDVSSSILLPPTISN